MSAVGAARGACWLLSAAALVSVALAPARERGDPAAERVAAEIGRGAVFARSDLDALVARLGPRGRASCDERTHRDLLLVRASLAETDLAAGDLPAFDRRVGEVEAAAKALLACSPRQSIGWLTLVWADGFQAGFGPRALRYLDRSYEFGPHEPWISVRRNPLALRVLDELSPSAQERTMREFVDIVRSGGARQAAAIFLAAAPAAQERLRAALLDLTAREMQRFDGELASLRLG